MVLLLAPELAGTGGAPGMITSTFGSPNTYRLLHWGRRGLERGWGFMSRR